MSQSVATATTESSTLYIREGVGDLDCVGWITVLSLVIFGGISTTISILIPDQMSPNTSGKVESFQHPFFFATSYAMGQALAYPFYILTFRILKKYEDDREETHFLTRGNRNFKVSLLIITSFFSLHASLLYMLGTRAIGHMTHFYFVESCLIHMVIIFSIAFMLKKLTWYEWLAVTLETFGLMILSISDYYDRLTVMDWSKIIIGETLILMSQFYRAIQYILEEKFLRNYNIPVLLLVGWQGIFGSCMGIALQILAHFSPASGLLAYNSRGVLEDIGDAIVQLTNNSVLLLLVFLKVLVTSLISCIGLSVTQQTSTIVRAVFDNFRVVVVWIFVFHAYDLNPREMIGCGIAAVGMLMFHAPHAYHFLKKFFVKCFSIRIRNNVELELQ